MLQKKYFKYDKNYLLKQAQLDSQEALLHAMVKKVVRFYELQYNPLGLMDELMINIHGCKKYQIENLSELYEEMAGIYRYNYGSNQLELLFDGSQHIDKYQQDWSAHFEEQITDFCFEKTFLKGVIEAAILFPSERKALLAHNRLRAFIHDRFRLKVHKYKGIVPMKVAKS